MKIKIIKKNLIISIPVKKIKELLEEEIVVHTVPEVINPVEVVSDVLPVDPELPVV